MDTISLYAQYKDREHPVCYRSCVKLLKAVKEGKEFDWRILKAGTRVDFTRTKDVFLDCNNLSY